MEEEKIEFIKPINPTDPIVEFDPEFDFSNIVLPIFDYMDDAPHENMGEEINPLNVAGIMVPLVKLNNKFITADKIYMLTISLVDFLPTINITIDDSNRNIQASDVPGMNNVITVIFTAPVNGANKKISMDFYITDCTFDDDNTVSYKGEYKCNGMKQVKYSQIGDGPLSTYEYLSKIAKELKLGFACTGKCKEINDKKWRQLYSETYANYIMKEIRHAGLDKDSIFDTWIDNFGYLVLVNLPYVLNEKVDPKQLSIKVVSGKTTTLPENRDFGQDVKEVYRIISNSEENININNLYISEYHSSVDNSKILKKGTKNKYFYLSSPCDQNILVIENIRLIENSVDGMVGQDEYVYENIEFIGTNQTDDEGCELYQGEIVENFLNGLYYKSLVVTLPFANYSLQRGMLVYVMINEYEPENKQFIQDNAKNAFETKEQTKEEDPPEYRRARENIADMNNGMMNPSLSGLYYIKGMEFSYKSGDDKISQTLTLIKRELQSGLTNKYTTVKA